MAEWHKMNRYGLLNIFLPRKDQSIGGCLEKQNSQCFHILLSPDIIYLEHPFSLLSLWGCGWGDSIVTQAGHATCSAVRLPQCSPCPGEPPSAAWDCQQTHIILWHWHILGLHLVYILVHSGYVIVTFLKSDFSLGTLGKRLKSWHSGRTKTPVRTDQVPQLCVTLQLPQGSVLLCTGNDRKV